MKSSGDKMFEIKLDHIGVAVNGDSKSLYEILGLKYEGDEVVSSEGVRVEFLNTSNDAKIELLHPLNDQSPVHKFIEKRGAGIHHICFRVKNLDSLVEHLKKKGIQLITEFPKMGAHNCRIIFIHPKSTGGVLIELSEVQED